MPRGGLTTERVIADARALVDSDGIDALTLATLATRLGVRSPSLYKHVASLDAVRQRLAVLSKVELGEALTLAVADHGSPELGGAEPGGADPGGAYRGGDAALHAIACAYRQWALQHPGRYSLTLRAPHPDDEADVTASGSAIEVMLSALRHWKLSEEATVHTVRSLRAVLHGFVTLEQAGAFALPVSLDESFTRAIDDLIAAHHP
ncbi:MAG: WHG domain-containing protein [Microbacteriaceae bacterium]